ncbi:MAG: type II toxin-antitoxin system MqsR family toxin [Candidatus Competibacteraceae bacterium]
MVDCVESRCPAYPLDKIRAAAEAGNIVYGGRKVQRDIANLGDTKDEVIRCIVGLRGTHYQKTLTFTDKGTVFDVYSRDFEHHEHTDRIYMKLRLLPNGQGYVSVGSFHL